MGIAADSCCKHPTQQQDIGKPRLEALSALSLCQANIQWTRHRGNSWWKDALLHRDDCIRCKRQHASSTVPALGAPQWLNAPVKQKISSTPVGATLMVYIIIYIYIYIYTIIDYVSIICSYMQSWSLQLDNISWHPLAMLHFQRQTLLAGLSAKSSKGLNGLETFCLAPEQTWCF